MLKRRPKERIPERVDPGDREPEPCSPGSIEQELDMCQEGTLKGDEILHSHGVLELDNPDSDPKDLDQLVNRSDADLEEADREGDEMSGDDHSSGLQGGETEIKRQAHIDPHMPGSFTEREEQLKGVDFMNQEAHIASRAPDTRSKKKIRDAVRKRSA